MDDRFLKKRRLSEKFLVITLLSAALAIIILLNKKRLHFSDLDFIDMVLMAIVCGSCACYLVTAISLILEARK